MATVFITGASRGIGIELCRAYSERGDAVIAACRATTRELDALGVRVLESVDVTDSASLARLPERAGVDQIDVLVNNAGVLWPDGLESLDVQRIREQFEVNALGPLLVSRALLPLLGRGSRLAIVSSRMGSIGDNTSGGYYGYRMSKAAANMVGMSLARDLEQRGISVAVLHPGMVATEMTGGRGIPPRDAALGLVARIDALDAANSGTFWHASGEVLPW